jgi:hypothetical protein
MESAKSMVRITVFLRGLRGLFAGLREVASKIFNYAKIVPLIGEELTHSPRRPWLVVRRIALEFFLLLTATLVEEEKSNPLAYCQICKAQQCKRLSL